MTLFSQCSDIRNAAVSEYRLILRRAPSPKPTDARRLVELLPVIGLTLQDIEADERAVLEEQRLLSLIEAAKDSAEEMHQRHGDATGAALEASNTRERDERHGNRGVEGPMLREIESRAAADASTAGARARKSRDEVARLQQSLDDLRRGNRRVL